MYTCCPICKTNFNITEAQLQVAQGKVRCGSCKAVFNARQHIHYRPLHNIQPQSTPLKTSETQKTTTQQKRDPSTKTPGQTELDPIFAPDTRLAPGTANPITQPEEAETQAPDFEGHNDKTLQQGSKDDKKQNFFNFIHVAGDDQEDTPVLADNTRLDLDADPELNKYIENEDLHQAIDTIIRVDNTSPHSIEGYEDEDFAIEIPTEQNIEFVDENDIDKLFASIEKLTIPDLELDTSEPQSDSIKPEIKSPLDERFNPEPLETGTPNKDGSENSDINQEIDLANQQDDSLIPHRLRDAVAALEQQPLSLTKYILYALASLVLIALLLSQLVLFKSSAIAHSFPALQPLLISVCGSLPCRYTGKQNYKEIKIQNRDVRLHPKIKGALLISATIINQASYTQPYPTILLKFTDLTGATVAQRYFQPKEYLGLLNKPFALMPSKKSIQLNIEILDPGSDAINFQFYFL
ncbi:DUF3426 domain-containing protein [Beggiatoa alba]|nr:DUF3426 domain-containing protein [Beggiatoa alba]